MKKRHNIPRLRLIIILLLVAVVSGAVYFGITGGHASGATTTAYIATDNIGINQPVTGHYVARTVSALGLGPAPVLDTGVLQGAIARAPIFAGEVLQTTRLYGPGLRGGHADESVQGRNDGLITIPVDPHHMPLTGLQPGDHVAVIATIDTSSVATGRAVTAAVAAGAASSTGSLGAGIIEPFALVTSIDPAGKYLTIDVPADDGPTLSLLAKAGDLITMQLRPDASQGLNSSTNLRQIVAQYRIPTK